MSARGGICAGCQRPRHIDELLAYWPVAEPGRRFYVCRPTVHSGDCFRRKVDRASVHVIAQASGVTP